MKIMEDFEVRMDVETFESLIESFKERVKMKDLRKALNDLLAIYVIGSEILERVGKMYEEEKVSYSEYINFVNYVRRSMREMKELFIRCFI